MIYVSWIALFLAEFFLAWDLFQTLDIKNHPQLVETNILLGPHPSDAKIVAYFVFVIIATLFFWAVIPLPWNCAAFIVAVVEAIQVNRNIRTSRRIRGT